MKLMLKVMGLFLLLGGLCKMTHAAVPLYSGTNPAFIGAQLWSSSSTVSGGISQIVLPAVTNRSNCFTYVEAGLLTSSTFYILDGGTTDYVKYGANLVLSSSASTTGTYTRQVDALNPLCGTPGNSMTFQTQGAGSSFINVDGFTSYGPAKN